MPLSRLENFLKNVEGNILYVNPSDLDSTDSIENQGNSLTRPFKTIQRALLESARFSYQIGQNNDKFNRTTILLYPGVHEIDNRPGFNVVDSGGSGLFRDRNGNIQTLNQLTADSNYNINDSTNELYKYNSVEGGVIIPRGTSIVGLDLRKTIIRPKFVPDPTDDAILRSAIFRVTGGCYFWQFTALDGDLNGSVYKDYTTNRYTPSFSHHKLTVFEYADGVNGVGIGTSTSTTDLSMYYHKVQRAYGDSSGRAIGDFPATLDMQAKLPEYEVVGPLVNNDVGITSIRAGAGSKTNTSTTITVDCSTPHGLVVDSPFRVAGVNTYPNIYNGNFQVTGVSSERIFTYRTSSSPLDGLPSLDGDEKIIADTDSVSGASPYIFNCSVRSVYGLCGMHADGSKATGFKSMIVAQYTGVGLQKDNNAFLLYNSTTGQYDNNATVADSEKPLYINSDAVYRPSYESYHVKCSNKSFIQIVSVFAIGYAKHFLTESGGDQSITNSNSNFGAKALVSKGFQDEAFNRDNKGYITHIVPPQRLSKSDKSVEWLPLNVGLSTVTTSEIYLDGFTDPDIPPPVVVEGYRIGARSDFNINGLCSNPDLLKISIAGVGTFSAPIKMLNSDGTPGPSRMKEYDVGFVGAANSITSSTLTLRQDHELYAGESVRVISDDGSMPDGLDSNTVYYAVTNDSQNETLNADQIKLARTENEAILGGSGNFITINNNKGGKLRINSRVSDKLPGDFAHPVQYSTSNSNWYVKTSTSTSENTIKNALISNKNTIGPRTNKSFFERKEDTRSLGDKIYKLRFVIPKTYQEARPPIPGFVIQESSTVGVTTATDFTDNVPDATVLRNLRILKSVDRDSNTGITTIVTEKPHNYEVGDEVKILNVKSSGNTVGAANTGYNITRKVVGITSSKGLEVSFANDPGSFINTLSTRNNGLPTISRKTSKETFVVYRVETLKAHEYNKQDGVYHLICIDGSIKPTVNEFGSETFNQQIENLYPQFDADNFVMDPSPAASFAVNEPIGKVVTNSLQYSVTKEFANRFAVSNGLGIAVTFAEGSTAGISTVYLDREHNLNTIVSVSLGSTGSGYGAGITTTLYNASLVYPSSGDGSGATVNIDVDGIGGITGITIVDGGSAYSIGDTLQIVGVQTGAGHVVGSVTVTKTSDNVGDAVQIVGVGTSLSRYASGYNGVYKITGIKPKEIAYDNGFWPGYYDVNTVGMQTGFALYAGNAPVVSAISYSSAATGIVTVTTSGPHGLNVNNPFRIVGAAQTIYNYETIVNEKISNTQFNFKFNEVYTPVSYTSGASVLPIGYGARGGRTEAGNERVGQRLVPFVSGISTTMSAASINSTSTTLTLSDSSGFYKGDYVQIDAEVIRISSDFSSNAATVLRGQLGTRSASHDASSLVKKIRIVATEKRRHSILRASGHTFEYLGFGPGNYSTGMPQKQTRVLTKEEQFLSQSLTSNGGATVYTGVNDTGDFYIGNKLINSQDGTESTFNIPIPTVTGASEDAAGAATRLDVIFDSVSVREGLTVDGENNTTVKINAPTTISEKLTTTGTDGIEAVQISINGGLPQNRTITYSPTKPTASGTVGDVTFNSNPSFGQYIGWIFTQEGWKRFGLISTEADSTKLSVGTVGVGSTSASRIGQQDGLDVRGTIVADAFVCAGVCTFSGGTTFASVTFDLLNVGIATITNTLDVQQSAKFSGITTYFSGSQLKFRDDVNAHFGIANDLTVRHDSGDGNLVLNNNSMNFTLKGSQDISIQDNSGNNYIFCNNYVSLYYNGSEKLRTTNTGVTVYGTIAGVSTGADRINVDEAAGNTNYQVLFSENQGAGYQRPYIDSESGVFTYNPSTNTLSAGVFNGSGASLTNIPNSATTATNSNTANTIVARDASGNFSAGTITASLSGNASTASQVYINNDDSGDTNCPILFTQNTTAGNKPIYEDSALYFDNTNNILYTTTFSGALSGNASTASQVYVTNTTSGTYYVNFSSSGSANRDIRNATSLSYNATTDVLSNTSDERLKENIEIISNPIEKVQQLRGVTFDWKKNGAASVGVIAQDVEKVLPQLVTTDDETGYKSVGYANMVAVLIEAVKEQQTQIEELKAKVDELSK